MKTVRFINISNGIDYLVTEPAILQDEISFIRIPSTWCEQKLWDQVIQNLDTTLLLNLALGNWCVIYDKSAHHKVSRACSQGVEFIRYALNKCWFNREGKVDPGQHNYFREEYKKLSKCSIRKLKYFRKFIPPDQNHFTLVSISENMPNKNDGNYSYFRDVLINWNNKEIVK